MYQLISYYDNISIYLGINLCISGDELELLLDSNGDMELSHGQIEYGRLHTTLAWQIFPGPEQSSCNISQILSYPQCQPDNVLIDITTNDTTITVPSERLHTSGGLADFNLSSLSDQPGINCPRLSDTVRFDGKSL